VSALSDHGLDGDQIQVSFELAKEAFDDVGVRGFVQAIR
jgi:hypothetical protein